MSPLRKLVLVFLTLAAVAPASASAAPYVGFNDISSLTGRMPFDTAAQAADNANVTSARAVVDWSWVEYAPGQYSWGMLNGMYWAAINRGQRPLIGVTGAPRWTWQADAQASCPEATHCAYPHAAEYDGAYQEFLRQLVRRYPQAAGIQIGNEPNMAWAWAGGLSPARYTHNLKLAYSAIKSVNPNMPVISAGLAPVLGDVNRPDAMNVRQFLQGMYANGAKGNMDGLAIHPYPYSVNLSQTFGALSAAKEVRMANGDSVPLWITEYGMTTSNFTAFDQGITLPAIYDVLRTDPEVAGIYLHTLYDDPANGSFTERGYGLLTAAGTPKPAFCNLAKANASTWTCPTGVAPAAPSAAQSAQWKAQILVQAAADAARKFRLRTGSYTGLTSAALNGLDPRIKKAEALDTALPGLKADPARIAIVPVNADAVLLCNASTSLYSYCYATNWNTRWVYGKGTGTIITTASAVMGGATASW